MTDQGEERFFRLLRAAMPPITSSDPGRDLWPRIVRRIQERPHVSPFDRVLVALMLVLAPFFPRAVLVLVYAL